MSEQNSSERKDPAEEGAAAEGAQNGGQREGQNESQNESQHGAQNGAGEAAAAPGPQGAQQEGAAKRLTLHKIYVKDLSFESPNSPQVFSTQGGEPQIQLNMKSNSRNLGNNNWEVLLTLTVDAKNSQSASSLFLVEVQQAGIFALEGYTDEELRPLLGSYCPHVLYPYAREAVSDLVTRGGFPQLLLQPINFDAVYRQTMAQQQGGVPGSAAAEGAGGAGSAGN